MPDEKINRLDKELAVLQKQMEDHCKNNEENFAEVKADTKDVKADIKDLKEVIDKWLEKADSRYASKRTEQLFYSTLGAAIVYILYYIFKMVGIS